MSDGPACSVLMAPNYAESNPYQARLRDGLEGAGVAVTLAEARLRSPIIGPWLAAGRPEVVHVHWLITFYGTDWRPLAPLLAARLLVELLLVKALGASLVWTVHNLHDHEGRHPRTDRLMRRSMGRLADRIIVHCTGARARVREAYGLGEAAHIDVIPHGHYRGWYPDEMDRTAARRALGVDRDETVFLYFGIIRPYKNVPALIEAFRSLPDATARLVVVGNPWTEALRREVMDAARGDERIECVLEYVPDDAIQRYMRGADAVVLPFASVLTSGSALLAMSFDRALVLPDVGCPAEAVDPGGAILYDGDDLVGALEVALERADELVDMGARNGARAAGFDWASIAEATRRTYLAATTARREPAPGGLDAPETG